MVTYRQTTYNKFETPSGAIGEAPDGPGAFAHMIDQLDARLGAGGAEICANLTAVNAIPTTRCYAGKRAYAQDTGIQYTWSTGSSTWIPYGIDTTEATGAFTVASGWAIDSQEAFKMGAWAEVSIVFHRTGGNITVPTNGDIVNQTIATFRTGWAPLRSRSLSSGGTGAITQSMVVPGTGLQLVALSPTGQTVIGTGDSFSANGPYILAQTGLS